MKKLEILPRWWNPLRPRHWRGSNKSSKVQCNIRSRSHGSHFAKESIGWFRVTWPKCSQFWSF